MFSASLWVCICISQSCCIWKNAVSLSHPLPLTHIFLSLLPHRFLSLEMMNLINTFEIGLSALKSLTFRSLWFCLFFFSLIWCWDFGMLICFVNCFREDKVLFSKLVICAWVYLTSRIVLLVFFDSPEGCETFTHYCKKKYTVWNYYHMAHNCHLR